MRRNAARFVCNGYNNYNVSSSELVRVGQGFGVYGIQGLFKSGISAEIWVFGISCFLNFRYKVQCISTFPGLVITHPKTHEFRPVHACYLKIKFS